MCTYRPARNTSFRIPKYFIEQWNPNLKLIWSEQYSLEIIRKRKVQNMKLCYPRKRFQILFKCEPSPIVNLINSVRAKNGKNFHNFSICVQFGVWHFKLYILFSFMSHMKDIQKIIFSHQLIHPLPCKIGNQSSLGFLI